jgi:hypothetical protein
MHSAPSPRLLVTGNERYFAPIEKLRVELAPITCGEVYETVSFAHESLSDKQSKWIEWRKKQPSIL